MPSEKTFCLQLVTLCYDVLTILVSIADVAFHIVVLIDFYQQERLVFFGISLSILIIAQCAQAYFFAFRFQEEFEWNIIDWEKQSWLTFCCCLPLAQISPFYWVLPGNETAKEQDSKMLQWLDAAWDKHCGFCIQAAFESFPETILQIVAIIYYQDTNYIYITSLLLSVFSVMIKSLIFSRGTEKYTLVWTWLCVITDYFGIFFLITWLFYEQHYIYIDHQFLAYFDILFIDIWVYKFAVSTLLPATLILVAFFGVIYWLLSCVNFLTIEEFGIGDFENEPFFNTLLVCCWFVLTPVIIAFTVILVFIACIIPEIICFSIVAFMIYDGLTTRVDNGYYSMNTEQNISLIVDFLSSGKHRNRGLRILAVNYGLHRVDSKRCSKLCQFIDTSIRENGYKQLRIIKRADIRNECMDPVQANLIKLWKKKFKALVEWVRILDFCVELAMDIMVTAVTVLLYIFTPIFILSKLLHVLYPWIIVAYLGYNKLFFSLGNGINVFHMIMLWIYIGLQLLVFVFGIKAFRINYWLRHIEPGKWKVRWGAVDTEELEREMCKFFNIIFWSTDVERIILEHFGYDVGDIILSYCNKELK